LADRNAALSWRFFVQALEVIGDQQLAETVDGEDRRLQIVRKHAEKTQELLVRDGLLDCAILVFQRYDSAPPACSAGCNL